jgi:hypothetical protein
MRVPEELAPSAERHRTDGRLMLAASYKLCPINEDASQLQNENHKRAKISHERRMEYVGAQLRDLRMTASPRLSVRGMAAELDMPLGTYANYESARYKKTSLPLDLTRQIAAVLARRNVDPAEVMKLAGLSEAEAEPEGRAVEAALPQVQYVSLQLALPSEAALRDMFLGLLALIPEGSSRYEAAEILAQRLPTGFAAIGPVVIAPGLAEAPADAAVPQPHARAHPEPGQPLHM